MNDKMPICLVSACLCGIACRYDGKAKPVPEIIRMHRAGLAVAVCPECLGGLKAPRLPCEIRNGRVFDKGGSEHTEAFRRGAELVLGREKLLGAATAILQERSPSCGSSVVYDGSFSGRLVPGQGVTTAILRENGVVVHSENDIPAFLLAALTEMDQE